MMPTLSFKIYTSCKDVSEYDLTNKIELKLKEKKIARTPEGYDELYQLVWEAFEELYEPEDIMVEFEEVE